MGRLTGTKHGDSATALMKFYHDEADKLEAAGSYFMAAVALGAALETALLTFILVEWGEGQVEELEIPDKVLLDELIDAAKCFELLKVTKFQESEDATACSVEDVIREIQQMRNNLHPGRALRTSFDPMAVGQKQYLRLRKIYCAVLDNLERNL